MLKATMDRAVVAIDARDMVPLAAGAQVKDDPIQDPPSIYPLAARTRRRIETFEQRFNPFPEFIRNFPQGGQRSFVSGHRILQSGNLWPLSLQFGF
jgi:hypothetical protein